MKPIDRYLISIIDGYGYIFKRKDTLNIPEFDRVLEISSNYLYEHTLTKEDIKVLERVHDKIFKILKSAPLSMGFLNIEIYRFLKANNILDLSIVDQSIFEITPEYLAERHNIKLEDIKDLIDGSRKILKRLIRLFDYCI